MSQIMSHGFHPGDSFEHRIWVMCFDWLKCCAVALEELANGFHAMTHYEP